MSVSPGKGCGVTRAPGALVTLMTADGIAGCADDCNADSWSSVIKNTAAVLVPEDLLPAARKHGKRSLLALLTPEGTAGAAAQPGAQPQAPPCSSLALPPRSRFCSLFCPDGPAEPTLRFLPAARPALTGEVSRVSQPVAQPALALKRRRGAAGAPR